jgi:hypothetical protein
MNIKMPRRIVRCPYGGHHFQVEIKEGYVSGRAIRQESNLEGLPGQKQACPICNRLLFIQYIP